MGRKKSNSSLPSKKLKNNSTPVQPQAKRDDFIRTLDDDGEEIFSDGEALEDRDTAMDPSFSFVDDDIVIENAWDFESFRNNSKKRNPNLTTVDEKITLLRKRKKSEFRAQKADSDDEDEEDDEDDDENENEDDDSDELSEATNGQSFENESTNEDDEDEDENQIGDDSNAMESSKDESDDEMSGENELQSNNEEEDEEEEEEEEEIIEEDDNGIQAFSDLELSKVLLKACSDLGYGKPTSIQSRCIPVGLSGKDICGSAHTGSGKTAAFMLPVLQRLLYRPKRIPLTRVLVLTPTRELAAQCCSMTQKLAKYTDIRTCLIVGGLSNATQEASLRARPDIIVATPGRLIDHLRNTQSVALDDIEVLILDEADRLLDMGFTEEVEEIVKSCPASRQTMLFSATMTRQVMNLASISLKDPIYIAVNKQFTVAIGLRQEFIRVKPQREKDREAMLVALCKHVFTQKTIIFVHSKRYAHRLKILFGLLDLNAVELHGNLTQTQRLEALELFRDKKVDFLIATDLASRGLDIVGIQTVINLNMPKTHAQYIHRVGRTARAGKAGRSCSFITDTDRTLFRDIVKKATNVSKRKIPTDKVIKYRDQIQGLNSDIEIIFKEEGEERAIRVAERDIDKAQNLLDHQKEIFSRPKRTWFQTTKEKNQSQKRSQVAVFGEEENQEIDPDQIEQVKEEIQKPEKLSKRQLKRKKQREEHIKESKKLQVSRKKRRKLALEESSTAAIKKNIKSAKSEFRPKKINTVDSHKKTNPLKSQKKEKAPKKQNQNPFTPTLAPRPKHKPAKAAFKSKKRYKRR